MDVMVDLETLGNGSNSVIIAIGAVAFDKEIGIGSEFYCLVDPQSCVDAGMQMDVSTVMWWMQQSDKARGAFKSKDMLPIERALQRFATWYPKEAALWGNGATFDNVILANAYRKTGIEQPWKYWADRCYRTLKSLRPDVKIEVEGIAHNALDDARNQAVHAIKLLGEIK